MVLLRVAVPGEAAELTELCLRSKAYWGYSPSFLESCRVELTLSPAELDPRRVRVAVRDGVVVGVVRIAVDSGQAQLERLFVDPVAIGSGVGRRMLDWARDAARADGATALVIESDPGAAPFYRHLGAVDAGVAASGSIPGRWLPRLVVAL